MFSKNSAPLTTAEKVFSKTLQFVVKNGGDERKVKLNVKIEANTQGANKVVVVQLTDDEDLFFLYNLVLTDEDFRLLKMQQGLLVDFSLFPQKFVELLEYCRQEQDKDVPKFLLCLNIGRVSATTESNYSAELAVVETNPFKHLTHLSLQLTAGSDLEVKKNLAASLQNLKAQKFEVKKKLQAVESSLTQRCKFHQDQVILLTEELEKLKSQLQCQTSELAMKHDQQLSSQKDMLVNVKGEYEIKMEELRQQMKATNERAVVDLEEALRRCRQEKQALSVDNEKLKQQNHDLSLHTANLEPELQKYRIEVQNLRRDKSDHDFRYNELERPFTQLKTKVALQEQELRDKEQVLIKSQQLSVVTQEQKIHLEKQLEGKTILLSKRESSLRTSCDEIKKANEIISKLQNDVKSNHAKLKVRSQIATEQEKVLTQNEETLKKLNNKFEILEKSNNEMDEENKKLQDKLMNAEKNLKTNENVIAWLNKQLNEVKIEKSPKLASEDIPPQIRNYYNPATQSSGLPASTKFQISQASTAATFVPFERSGQIARPPLSDKYFQKVSPVSQSTPNNGSVRPKNNSRHCLGTTGGYQSASPNFPLNVEQTKNSANLPAAGNKQSVGFRPGNNTPLASSYFPMQKKSS